MSEPAGDRRHLQQPNTRPSANALFFVGIVFVFGFTPGIDFAFGFGFGEALDFGEAFGDSDGLDFGEAFGEAAGAFFFGVFFGFLVFKC